MRATRFRTDAGLLSWGTKEGTIPKNQRLLDLIPDQFKNPAVNSIKGWRDLNPAEVKAIKQGAKKTPQKARKKNRAAKAEKERQDQESTMNASVGGQRSLKDGQNISYGHEDAWLGAPYGQDGDSDDLEGPMSGPQIHRMITDHNSDWQVSSVRGEFAENVENQPFFSNSAHPRKWSRDSFNAASEKNISDLAQSRVNFPTQAQPSENEEAMPTFPKSRVSTKKLNHDGQSDSHESGPRIQFTQNDSIRSMNQRYDTPPSRVQKTKRTASKTVKKRKQTGNNTTTHSQRQRPKRRTEEHATKQTLAPNSQTTAESAPGVKDVIPATKYVIPSQNGQMNAQNPGFSWRATNVPNYFFQDLIGYVHQDDGQQEDIATGQVEQLPSINEQYEDPERVMSPIYWP